jgi:hypothetical protein
MWKLLLAVGCLSFSSGITYCAFRLIKNQHAGVLPSWAAPFLGLTFITSIVLSAWFVRQYFLPEPMTLTNPSSGRWIGTYDGISRKNSRLRAPGWGLS